MKLSHIIFGLILFLLCTSISFGGVFPRYHTDAAVNAIGGASSLYGYNSSAVIYNPALLNRSKFRLDIVNLGFVLDNKFVDAVKFVSDNSDKFQSFDSLSSDPVENRRLQQEFLKSIEPYDDQWFDLGLVPQIGFTFKHFGLVITNSTQPSVKIDRGIFNPAVVVKGYSDLGVYAGYGSSMTRNLFGKTRTFEYGVGVHFLNRRQLSQKRVSAADISNTNDIANEVTEDLKEKKSGFGIDVGTIWPLTDNWEGAVVIHDLFGTFDGKMTKPVVVLGSKYNLKQRFLADVSPISRWIGVFEFEDFFSSNGTTLFYKTHLGTEATLYNRLLMRFGINRGYPGYGVGLDLFLLKLNYSFYGEELGRAPGQIPSYRHQLQLNIGW